MSLCQRFWFLLLTEYNYRLSVWSCVLVMSYSNKRSRSSRCCQAGNTLGSEEDSSVTTGSHSVDSQNRPRCQATMVQPNLRLQTFQFGVHAQGRDRVDEDSAHLGFESSTSSARKNDFRLAWKVLAWRHLASSSGSWSVSSPSPQLRRFFFPPWPNHEGLDWPRLYCRHCYSLAGGQPLALPGSLYVNLLIWVGCQTLNRYIVRLSKLKTNNVMLCYG